MRKSPGGGGEGDGEGVKEGREQRIRSMTKKKSIGGGEAGGGYIMDAWLTTLYTTGLTEAGMAEERTAG